jgi:aminocarboxymuconate-semialdehyde decarboxylase
VTIDIYSHACPSGFINAVQALYPTAESAALGRKALLFDTDARIRFMDAHGIDMQVLVLVRPPLWLGMPKEHMYRLLRIAHEGLAAMVAARPDRFVGVAVAPRVDDCILDEIRYAWNDLGLVGVQIFTNIEGAPVDCKEMWPLYSKAAEAQQPIWIHPQHNPHTYPWITESLLDRSLAWPFDTAVAVARLAYSGVLDRYPQLRFITHHLGGVVPYLASRLEAFDEEIADFARDGLNTAGSKPLTRPIGEYLRSFYGDTAISNGTATLECGITFFGLNHVAFGTDFPMGTAGGTRWTGQILSTIADALPDARRRQQVLDGTARQLLGLS